MESINVSTFSDGTAIVRVGGRRYKYYVSNVARLLHLKDKMKRTPGKLFNEIKEMGELVEKS